MYIDFPHIKITDEEFSVTRFYGVFIYEVVQEGQHCFVAVFFSDDLAEAEKKAKAKENGDSDKDSTPKKASDE